MAAYAVFLAFMGSGHCGLYARATGWQALSVPSGCSLPPQHTSCYCLLKHVLRKSCTSLTEVPHQHAKMGCLTLTKTFAAHCWWARFRASAASCSHLQAPGTPAPRLTDHAHTLQRLRGGKWATRRRPLSESPPLMSAPSSLSPQ